MANRFCADVEEQATPEPDGATALQGNLVLRIWEPGNPERQGLSLEARGVLPLQPRDRVRLTAEVNRAAYLYLIWIDSGGKPMPLFPWCPGNWESASPRTTPDAVSLPGAGRGCWSCKGVSGLETLLPLARGDPLPWSVNLHTFPGVLPCAEGRSSLIGHCGTKTGCHSPERGPEH